MSEEDHIQQMQGKLVVGIDLGTTNSCVAKWDEQSQQPVMLKNADDEDLTPSMVGWYPEQQRWTVGEEARKLGQTHPENVAYSIKRYIGREYNEQISDSSKDLSYPLIAIQEGQEETKTIKIDFGRGEDGQQQLLTPTEISTKILRKLREDAALALNVPLDDLVNAVITVPAYFNEPQRSATQKAGYEAGFTEIYLLSEPIAAALAYRDIILHADPQKILVYDLGGGTFDISLIEGSRDESGYIFSTLLVDGDTQLGGDDIDMSIVNWCVKEIEKHTTFKIDADDPHTKDQLRRQAEQAKKQLSQVPDDPTTLTFTQLACSQDQPLDTAITITGEQLDMCASAVIQKTIAITRRAIEDIEGLSWDEIDRVILVGGQTLMPLVRKEIQKLTGLDPLFNNRPQLAVALGAGEYAHILHAGKKALPEHTLIEVIALPIGIRLDNDTFKILVPANSPLPYTYTYSVTTTVNNQSEILIEVLQGRHRDSILTSDCLSLKKITTTSPPAPAGVPRFDLKFTTALGGTMKMEIFNAATNETKKEKIDSDYRPMHFKPKQKEQ